MGFQSSFYAIPHTWRTPRSLVVCCAFELVFIIPFLALAGIAAPDLYRSRFWQEGYNHGWNSNPNEIIYDYANHESIHTPLPWSYFPTHFNVVIEVLALFHQIIKGIMFICDCFYPIVSLVIHAALVAVYAVSIHNQAGPDNSDPQHPQPGAPWYITKSCGPPVAADLQGYCKQAKALFSLTIILCAIYFIYLLLTLYSLYPTRTHRRGGRVSDIESKEARPWEATNPPMTPGTTGGLKSPTTPRTTAFNKLSSKGKAKASPKIPAEGGASPRSNNELPLRHHISMGDETYKGPNER